MNPGVLNSAKIYHGRLIPNKIEIPPIQGIRINTFLRLFVVKAQRNIGGRVSIRIIGPLVSSPIPIPKNNRYPQKALVFSFKASQNPNITIAILIHKKASVETTPACINKALEVADDHDIQVMIHTDTLNESGYVELYLIHI